MQHLVENRHEACNHTMWHARLDRYDDAFVQDQIGSGQDSIKAYLPDDYEIVTFALPLGMWPKNRAARLAGHLPRRQDVPQEGRARGQRRAQRLALRQRFNPRSINRFIVAPGALERQLAAYDRNPERRYVSDGNPNTVSVPQALVERVDRNRLAGRELRIIDADLAEASP
jgi:hypothetical protein